MLLQGFFFQQHGRFDLERIGIIKRVLETVSFPRFLGKHRAQLREGDLDMMAFISRRSLEGTMLAALAEDPGQLESPAFRQEVLTLLLNYLCK